MPEHHSTLSNAAGGESKKVSSGGFDLDLKCGLEGEVLIFSTFCTSAPTTQGAQAVRTGFLTCTNTTSVPLSIGSKI